MAWTKELPTEPGWYWWRLDIGLGTISHPRIVRVSSATGPDAIMRVTYIGSTLIERLGSANGYFWDEPIKPPVLPEGVL